jgi:hypothetical protein
LEEVAVNAGHKVWMEVDNYILMIVGDPLGILNQQHMSHPIHLINICIIELIN